LRCIIFIAILSLMETLHKAKPGRPAGRKQEKQKSDAVFRVRSALGMTQEEFAREMGCSIATIRKYEQGQVLPGGVSQKLAFAKVAKRAGVSLEGEG
jgi:DNA-binding transcriptional regulator YiaG